MRCPGCGAATPTSLIPKNVLETIDSRNHDAWWDSLADDWWCSACLALNVALAHSAACACRGCQPAEVSR